MTEAVSTPLKASLNCLILTDTHPINEPCECLTSRTNTSGCDLARIEPNQIVSIILSMSQDQRLPGYGQVADAKE
jgi:hypothetical protein